MPRSRRTVLQGIALQNTAHAGLWLDKFLEAQGDDESKKKLVKQIAKIKTPPAYAIFFKRWEAALKRAGAQIRHAETRGRLAINLGAESVLETSIALHRTYGVPCIPGSALKGLAASFAHQHLDGDEWRKESGWAYAELFGTTEQAGCVAFFDALYVPRSGHAGKALWPDIVTVHHPEYYRGENSPPADWDNPTPIPFLTASGKFLIALAGPDAWVEKTFDILGYALARDGVGAKTNSGYGRMSLEGNTLSTPARQHSTRHTALPQKSVVKPSRTWPWRKGKISRDQRYVSDAENPQKRYLINRKQIVPKGYMPAGKAEVEYAVLSLNDGSQSVWVKKRFHPLSE